VAEILLIEDDAELRMIIGHYLEKHGHGVNMVDSLSAARKVFDESNFDLILSDVNLGDDSGIDYLEEVRGSGFEGGIIMMTGFANVDDAVKAMRLGADDYLSKPVRMQELLIITERVLKQRSESRQLRHYKRVDKAKKRGMQPLGQSEVWTQTITMAQRLAQIPVGNRMRDSASVPGGALTTILITGETGSGKGVIARHIHDSSPEHDCPFVHVNCTALPASLIESELFGHEKGAFTDAKATREGLFEMADGGTIFLDEIGDLDLPLQAKLLSVIENGRVRKVGATKEKAVRMRVLAATNKDLKAMVSEGTFREDLLFRINSFPVAIPNLRSRGEDVVLIAEGMLDHLRNEYGLEPAILSKDARASMIAHAWPGNVRELFNSVQRAAMLAPTSTITSEDLAIHGDIAHASEVPDGSASNAMGFMFDFVSRAHTAQDIERELMVQALDHTDGNITQAAKLIEMQRSSFRFRVEKYKITNSNQKIGGV